ncbi:MAG: PAS domain S-box protein [Acidobacteriota bacterium]
MARATKLARDSQFRRLVESIRDYAMFLLDADGHIPSWNAGATELYGYRSDEAHRQAVCPPHGAADPLIVKESSLLQVPNRQRGTLFHGELAVMLLPSCATGAAHSESSSVRVFLNPLPGE